MVGVRRLTVLSIVLAGLLFVPRVVHPVRGDSGCGPGSLHGPYGVLGSGSLFGAPGAFVAALTFDGAGKLGNTPLTLNAGGAIDPIDASGTYTVNPDCTGRISLYTAHHNPARSHFHDTDIVIVDGGKEAYFIVGGPKDHASDAPPPGETLGGVMKRM